jgi:hypothetical protein
MFRDGISLQIFHLIKLQAPYFFNPIISNLPLHFEQEDDTVIVDLIQEYNPTNQIDEDTIITGEVLDWMARFMYPYGYFDQIDCLKNRDKLSRAFDSITNSIGIEDPRLRILNYWMGIESLLGFGDNLTVRMKQCIPLIENCNRYYFHTHGDAIPYYSGEYHDKLQKHRSKRQEEIMNLYLKRGKITHGQYPSPYEHQSSEKEAEKYYNEISAIEEGTRIILMNLIIGILALGRIPSKKELEEATIDGMFYRKDHDKCVENASNFDY